jgi:hypothetical protein
MHREQLEFLFPELTSKTISIDTDSFIRPDELRVSELSTWICKSMEYLMQDEGILYGPISTLFPLKVAYKVFQLDLSQNEEQLDWCQRIVDRLVFKGVDLSTLL